MRLNKKTLSLLTFLILIAASYIQQEYFTSPHQDIAGTQTAPTPTTPVFPTVPASESARFQIVSVTQVVDGDTIKLLDGRTLRYIGIDTPETRDPRRGVQCYGREASTRNKELVHGQMVRIEKDVSETDRYGRLLRYVYLHDGTMVNAVLVQEGFAQSSAYPPDIRYQDLLDQAELDARSKNHGLWGECSSESE